MSSLISRYHTMDSDDAKHTSAKLSSPPESTRTQHTILKQLIGHFPEYASVVDHNASVIYSNAAFSKLLGAESPECNGSFLNLLPLSERANTLASIATCMNNGIHPMNIIASYKQSNVTIEWSIERLSDVESCENYLLLCGKPTKSPHFSTFKTLFGSKASPSRASAPPLVNAIKKLMLSKRNSQVYVEDTPYSSPSQYHRDIDVDSEYLCALNQFGEQQLQQRQVQRTRHYYVNQIETATQETLQLNHKLEIKRTFVKAVAHEIRTPLNIITSGLSLLQLEHPVDGKVQTIIEDMQLACTAAVDIVGDFLTYEKLDSDICTLNKSIVNISVLVETVMRPFRVQAKYHQITLELQNELGAVCFIDGDEYKLTQVLRNLISNALKFSKSQSTVVVTLTASCHQVYVHIKDQGAGISVENQAKLFRNIIQFNPKELQGGGGSGIGLWVSKKLIDAHGGAIGVFSAGEGLGSTFFIGLPLCAAPPTSPSAHPKDPLIRHLSCMDPEYFIGREIPRLLIVDDSACVRKMICRLLTQIGVDVHEAKDGAGCIEELALAIAKGIPYDAVLMDLSMGAMSGIEAARQSRAQGFTGKIYGVTGESMECLRVEFIAAGADQVFLKPLTEECMTQILDQVTKK